MPESLKLKISERDDLADLLALIPTWIFGAVVWYAFSKLILDSLTDKKPGTEINSAIIASDVAGVTFPPGVALAAQIDVTLTALGVKDELLSFLEEAGEKPLGLKEGETALKLGQELIKAVTAGFILITGFGRK